MQKDRNTQNSLLKTTLQIYWSETGFVYSASFCKCFIQYFDVRSCKQLCNEINQSIVSNLYPLVGDNYLYPIADRR